MADAALPSSAAHAGEKQASASPPVTRSAKKQRRQKARLSSQTSATAGPPTSSPVAAPSSVPVASGSASRSSKRSRLLAAAAAAAATASGTPSPDASAADQSSGRRRKRAKRAGSAPGSATTTPLPSSAKKAKAKSTGATQARRKRSRQEPVSPAATSTSAAPVPTGSAPSSKRKQKRSCPATTMDSDDGDDREAMASAAAAFLSGLGVDDDSDDGESLFGYDHEDDDAEEEDDADGNADADTDEAAVAALARAAAGSAGPDASAALHGLLMRLGGSGMFGGGSSGRFKTMLEGLQAMGDESRQSEALQEVAELLLMGTEETLHGFRVDQFVPALHTILDMEYQPQMALMACRALANMIEALPRSTGAVAACVPSLCNKLLLIEYIDLAEQSLTTLYKLSRDQGLAILKAGGMGACLTFLDFFSITLQRTALQTAANVCQHVTLETFDLVKDTIPILSTLLKHRDKALMESACTCFSRLVQCLRASPDALLELTKHGLVAACLHLVSEQRSDLSDAMFVTVIRMLWTLCQRCHSLVRQLHRDSVGTRICGILKDAQRHGTDDDQQQAAGGVAFAMSPKHLQEIVTLINELLPVLPSSLFFVKHLDRAIALSNPPARWEWQMDNGATWRPYSGQDCRTLEAARERGDDAAVLTMHDRQYIVHLDRMTQSNRSTRRERPVRRVATDPVGPAVTAKSDARAKMFVEEPELLKPFGSALLGVLFDIYLSSATPAIRYKCLEALVKLCHYGAADLLKELMESVSISAYLSDLLSSGDSYIILGALQMCNSLMEKLPGIFHVYFRRQGVVHQLHELAKAATSSSAATGQGASETSAPADGKHAKAARKKSTPSTKTTPSPKTTGRRRRSPRGSVGKGEAAATAETTSADGDDSGASKTKSKGRHAKAAARSSSGSAASAATSTSRADKEMIQKQMQEEVQTQAQALLKLHFADSSPDPTKDPHEALETLRSLSALAKELQAAGDVATFEVVMHKVIKQIEHSDVSSFETLQSGLLGNLTKFLTEHGDVADQRRARLQAFAAVMFPPVRVDAEPSQAAAKFVKLLHGALNTVENFVVRIETGARSPGATLTTPIKLKLEREADCETLKEFPPQQVLIDPLASIQAIEDFLWPRVKMSKAERAKATASSRQLRKLRSSGSKSSLRSQEEDPAEAAQDDGADEDVGDYAEADFEDEEDVDDDEDDDDGQQRSSQTARRGEAIEFRPDAQPSGSEGAAATAATAAAGAAAAAGASASGSVAARASTQHHLTVCLNGTILESNITIYQAIKAFATAGDGDNTAAAPGLSHLGRFRSSEGAYTLTYRTRRKDDAEKAADASMSRDRSLSHVACAVLEDPFERLVLQAPPPSLGPESPVFPVTVLLKILATLNDHRHLLNKSATKPSRLVPVKDFVNSRVSAKLKRQVSDFETLCQFRFPDWCKEVVAFCPFLASFEARLAFLHYTAFGCVRGLQRYKADHLNDVDSEAQEAARLSRTKVRISRDHLLASLRRIMHEVPCSKSVLEVEYFDEVGTGLGPTLEFYSLVCKAFQESKHGMWLESSTEGRSGDDRFVYCPNGLFPKPVRQSDVSTKDRDLFATLGRFVAKAILDSRLLDLPFSPVFYAWLLGSEEMLTLADIEVLDPTLHASWVKLADLCEEKSAISNDPSLDAKAKAEAVQALTLDGCTIDDLCLTFVLPGFPDIELKQGGAEESVTISNLDEYVKLLPRVFLVDAVKHQMLAFLAGFGAIVPVDRLHCFSREELHLVLNGSVFTAWSTEELASAIKTDHGYSSESPEIDMLCDVLSEFDLKQQRDFVSFLTGAPNLPVGGFASLRPPLTVVRKDAESGAATLPSVMTCQNYLKLPAYPTKEALHAKLVQAMTEGQGSFHLS